MVYFLIQEKMLIPFETCVIYSKEKSLLCDFRKKSLLQIFFNSSIYRWYLHLTFIWRDKRVYMDMIWKRNRFHEIFIVEKGKTFTCKEIIQNDTNN
jgi:hypothetical protein